MSALTFTLRAPPDQRLDLSALTPDALAGKTRGEIERIDLSRGRRPARVGDVFRVAGDDGARIVFAGGSPRFDRVGFGMSYGEIVVEGEAGVEAGRSMRGGALTLRGDAGPFAGSRMSGGVLVIEGNASERLAGPLAGETEGMNGGVLHVLGSAGARCGDRLRRGLMLIEGDVGEYAASRMIAGTLAVGGRAGDLPGYLMDRGALLLGGGAARLSPTFGDCGVHRLVAMRLIADAVAPHSALLAALFRMPLRRLAGDLAALGKGELLLPEP